MNRRAPLVLVAVGLLLVMTSSRRSQSFSQPASAAGVNVPFELVNRHIILKVRVNDSAPLSFVLDTGDQFAIINLDRAKELGLKLQGQVRVRGAGAQLATGAFVQGASFTIPGLAGFSQPLTLALPIGSMASRLGQDFDGIIGSEFIKQFVVEIDYQKRQIRFHAKTVFSYSGSGESIPIELGQDGHPVVEAQVTPLGGTPIKGKFVLDIGAGSALALYSPFVADHHLTGPNLKTIKALGGAGASGAINGQIGRVAELKIGKFRINRPLTFFAEDKKGAFASHALQGNIGSQIASRFRVFLDYGHERIILEPNARFAESFDRAFAGFSFQAEGSDYRTFRVDEVLKNSPASEAGLQQNDIIAAVDGKPAADLTLTKLSEMFERAATYKLTVRREEKILRLTLTPRRLV